ncbi:hypothetical protein AU252_20295 [Pseudarthrobacter sulfonivorans]|uniref:Uncharacterized protein n=1 Tax=Pseudarthrobacter sulfonivorans TaxID=121292 RepID=A0A0U3QNV7_9MICC|nr:hypothetical protein [Pseudarthrobacter sulfonivorans]ALV43211.1 hypothetical protein AU252_20295 [Pseudarthrobacter sulfonivorans]
MEPSNLFKGFTDSFNEALRSAGAGNRVSDFAKEIAKPTPIYKYGVSDALPDYRAIAEASAKIAPPPPAPTRDQAAEQLQHLEETKVLLAALNRTIQNAEEDRKRTEHDRNQQSMFNKRMTVVAIALSFAAVVAPFLVYFLEHGWWWEAYRP